jgi:hypothetical protein
MSRSIAVVLLVLAVRDVLAIAATVREVLREGRGHLPAEPSQRPWTAGNLPSQPYSLIRF